MAEKQYFIKRDGDIRGPFDSDEVKRLVSEQKILPLDEFSISARGPWKAAHRIPGIGLTGERDSQDSKPSFMKSRYFTIALGIASLVGTGLVGGLFEYIGSRIAANAAADADPFQNPQPDVFSEWMNRKEFMKLRATFENKRKGLTFWDLGYWIEDIEGKLVGGENKFRCKYSDNLDGLKKDQWHWQFELSENRFQKLNDQYTSQGFDLFKHHFFEDNQGRNHHQAIWRIDPLSALSKFEPKQTNSITPEQPEKKVEYSGRSQFATADLNSDGVITISEFPQLNKKKVVFKEHDRNDDGSLDFPEWFVFHMSRFNIIDHDKDGFVSYAEYMREHDQLDPKAQAEGKAWFKHADDGDGKLSKDEFSGKSRKPIEEWFKELFASDSQSISDSPETKFRIGNVNTITSLTAEQAAEVVTVVQKERAKSELMLNALTTIDAGVAQELAKFQGNFLTLNGLTTIDVGVAQELANLQGNLCLSLGGLSVIGKDVACELAKFKGMRLNLNGLITINKDVAHELAKFKGLALDLRGLTLIDQDTAQELAKFRGDYLGIGLSSIDTAAALELANFSGDELWIGVTTLETSQARELGKFHGQSLVLDKLSLLDVYQARPLAIGEYNLWLSGLTTIDSDVARMLVTFHKKKDLCLGVTELDEDVAQELAKFQGDDLYLNNLELIDRFAAEALAKFKADSLTLNKLSKIDALVAEQFARLRCKVLQLNGLKVISEKVATALMQFKGRLELNGLETVDKEVSQIFTTFQGTDLLFYVQRVDSETRSFMHSEEMIKDTP